MNYLPYASWGILTAGTSAARVSYFASWWLVDTLPEPSSGILSYFIPYIPYIPVIPMIGKYILG